MTPEQTIAELKRKNLLFKQAIEQLDTERFAQFANQRFPKCCGWKALRDAGLNQKTIGEIGAMVKIFIMETMLAIEKGGLAALPPNADRMLLQQTIKHTPFLERARLGLVIHLHEINTDIIEWQNRTDLEITLWEYLGMTQEEFLRTIGGIRRVTDFAPLAQLIREKGGR